MVEFNADGSIKLPSQFASKKEEDEKKFLTQRCMKLKREIVSFEAPKKCMLHLMLSSPVVDERFVTNIFKDFSEFASVPAKLVNLGEKKYCVEIGTDFRRCTDCCSLVNRYREMILVLEDRGNCTFAQQKFCHEDYFD